MTRAIMGITGVPGLRAFTITTITSITDITVTSTVVTVLTIMGLPAAGTLVAAMQHSVAEVDSPAAVPRTGALLEEVAGDTEAAGIRAAGVQEDNSRLRAPNAVGRPFACVWATLWPRRDDSNPGPR